MNESRELFIRGSKRFCEGLDRVRASVDPPVDPPDEQWDDQTFNSPERRIKEIDGRLKSGDMDLGVAEKRRFEIAIPALQLAYRRVLNCWDIKDAVAELRARHRKAVGQELLPRDVEEDIRRKEAL